jgi:hypothetical protein
VTLTKKECIFEIGPKLMVDLLCYIQGAMALCTIQVAYMVSDIDCDLFDLRAAQLLQTMNPSRESTL